jgi:acetyltransferase-like isoleucine patch superfamily enzyme
MGRNVKVWHFARVLQYAVIGDACSIGGGAEIGQGSVIGTKSRISAGVFLPSNSKIGESVFIGPNVTFTDDKHPRILNPGETYTAEPPVIEDFVAIGAGAIILPGIRIGHHSFVAAGAIVTKDVPPNTHIRGEPSREKPMPLQWTTGLVA